MSPFNVSTHLPFWFMLGITTPLSFIYFSHVFFPLFVCLFVIAYTWHTYSSSKISPVDTVNLIESTDCTCHTDPDITNSSIICDNIDNIVDTSIASASTPIQPILSILYPCEEYKWQWSETKYIDDQEIVEWTAYDTETIQQLEDGYRNYKTQIQLSKGFFNNKYAYVVSIEHMKQFNVNTGMTRQIRRVHPSTENQCTINVDNHTNFGSTNTVKPTIFTLTPDMYTIINPSTISSDETCRVCLEEFTNEYPDDTAYRCIQLNKCTGHYYHQDCINTWLQTRVSCPCCQQSYGIITGNQPDGIMLAVHDPTTHLPGFKAEDGSSGTITIIFQFSDGIQDSTHPSPGTSYYGDQRFAYLPDTVEGNEILSLFELAWKRRLIFTIGTSITRGTNDVIIWNGIHFKTCRYGGPTNYGYPDNTYFKRVREELASKGIM